MSAEFDVKLGSDASVTVKSSASGWLSPYLRRTIVVGIALLGAQLSFAGYGVVSALISKQNKINVYFFTFCRSYIASFLSVLMALIINKRLVFPQRPNHWEILYFAAFGLVSSCLNSIMYLQVVYIVSGSFVTILSQLVPLFTAILSYIFKVERIKAITEMNAVFKLVGVLLGCGFAVAITAIGFRFPSSDTQSIDWVYAGLIGVTNNLLYSFYQTLQSKLFYRNPDSVLCDKPFVVHAYCNLFGTAIYSLFAIPYLAINRDIVSDFPLIGLVPMFYASILCSCLGYGLMTWCNQMSSPLVVGASFSAQVAISLVLLRVFTPEVMHPSQYACSAGVIASVLFVIFAPLLERTLIMHKKKSNL